MIKPTKGRIFLDKKEITQDAMYKRSRQGIGFESDVQMEHWKILRPSGVTNRGDDEK